MENNLRSTPDPIQVALLSDIHGNLPALEAVYAHAVEQGAQTFLNAGDLVGYGPFPNECINFTRQHDFISVIGDYDQKVLLFPQKKEKFRKKKHPLRFISFEWAYQHTTPANLEYLQQLPSSIKIKLGEKDFLLTHGSPVRVNDYLGPHTTHSEWLQMRTLVECDFVITGNTHIFWVEEVKNTFFINPGSVGRQDDGDPRASYVMLSLGKHIKIEQHIIPYDISPISTALRSHELPQAFITMFEKGISLKGALEND